MLRRRRGGRNEEKISQFALALEEFTKYQILVDSRVPSRILGNLYKGFLSRAKVAPKTHLQFSIKCLVVQYYVKMSSTSEEEVVKEDDPNLTRFLTISINIRFYAILCQLKLGRLQIFSHSHHTFLMYSYFAKKLPRNCMSERFMQSSNLNKKCLYVLT